MIAMLWRDGELVYETEGPGFGQRFILPRMVQDPVPVDAIFRSPPAEFLVDKYNPKFDAIRKEYERVRGTSFVRDEYEFVRREGDVMHYEYIAPDGGG